MNADGVTLRLSVSRSAPRVARHGLVEALGLVGPFAEDVALLVSEVVTGSILHAGLRPHEQLHLDAWWTRGRLHVEVCDEGSRGASAAPATQPALELLGSLAQRWGVDADDPSRIWFEIAR